jgi:hypothetical protein
MDSIVTPIVILNLMVVGAITTVVVSSTQPRGEARWAKVLFSRRVNDDGTGTPTPRTAAVDDSSSALLQSKLLTDKADKGDAPARQTPAASPSTSLRLKTNADKDPQ